MLREQLLQKMREMRQDVKTPRLYNLGADKTYDAAKYEHLVLGPVLSDQHGLIKYSNSTLDLLQEDSPPKEDTLPRVPEQLPSKFGMTAKATALSRRWLGESHGPRTDEKMEGSVALGGRQFRDVEKERLVKSGLSGGNGDDQPVRARGHAGHGAVDGPIAREGTSASVAKETPDESVEWSWAVGGAAAALGAAAGPGVGQGSVSHTQRLHTAARRAWAPSGGRGERADQACAEYAAVQTAGWGTPFSTQHPEGVCNVRQ
ncbi:hypothetical protein CYMTET_36571 [Cymbomonas tetramitiformis]|uniref:Uncharacterized protein n=1 Tax=Cymbomonas tetramitiformis TaxID=36881 RepID=A0AAE0CGY3_9CHLO|nr:hypothetical protein CYMTET_36571 [Cymbomonas tetramitiformis]